MIKSKALKRGDLIGIAAPASHFDKNRFEAGVKWLKKMGFQVRFNEGIFERELYLAGGDERRAKELNSLIADREIAAILFARGGYGTQRIMPLIDISPLKESPKIIVGFSDLTPLLNAISSHLNLVTFYGPVVTQLGREDQDEETLKNFLNTVSTKEPVGELPLKTVTVIKEGSAKGPLAGGCLSVITTSIGTKYEIHTEGKILILEDTDEKIYAIDRMLTQLKNSGRLKSVKGIVFGSLNVHKDDPAPEKILTMIHKTLDDFPGPILASASIGHSTPALTVPIGAEAKISTSPPQIKIEGALLT